MTDPRYVRFPGRADEEAGVVRRKSLAKIREHYFGAYPLRRVRRGTARRAPTLFEAGYRQITHSFGQSTDSRYVNICWTHYTSFCRETHFLPRPLRGSGALEV